MVKLIKDPIYKEFLSFTDNEVEFIDNKLFKRLKNIKQLGSLDEVFPSATHTRASHSMGVSYLAEKFTTKLFYNSNINFSQQNLNIISNIKLAGLYHDIGHGPFSHVFDNHVLSKLCPNNRFRNHEIRSFELLKNNWGTFDLKNFNGYDIDMIQNMIEPVENMNSYQYQIIANKINSIDVDKFDYLLRDPYHLGFSYSFDCNRLMNKSKIIDNTICYDQAIADDIFDLYYTRYKFHREVYNHKAAKSIELMIADILLESNDVYNFPEMITNNRFLELDDTIISRIRYNTEPALNKCRDIINRIETRNIYKQIYKSNNEDINSVKDKIFDENPDDHMAQYHFIETSFDLCNEERSPYENIQFYKDGCTKMNLDDVTIRKLVPSSFKENIVSVYKK